MTIREAHATDLRVIRAIAHTTWPVAYAAIISPAQLVYMLDLMYSESSLRSQLEEKGHRFLLAEKSGEAPGFASFATGYQGRKSTRLHKLYALPDAQGTGIGQALLQRVEEEAKKAGDASLELNVNRFNTAKNFYLHHGFRIVRDEVIEIGEGYVMDDHVMEKML